VPQPRRQPSPADGQPSPADDPLARPAEPADPSQNASAGSSPGSSAAAEPAAFGYRDPGPGFDAEQAEADAEPVYHAEPAEIILWTPERIRRVLVLQGRLTHSLVGVAQADWVWQDDELELVCEPLAAHANRVPALAALAHLSDDAAVAAGFVTYALRSWLERTRELQRRQAAAQPQPVTGRGVDPEEEVPWTNPT
jgi:hypothetical protein